MKKVTIKETTKTYYVDNVNGSQEACCTCGSSSKSVDECCPEGCCDSDEETCTNDACCCAEETSTNLSCC